MANHIPTAGSWKEGQSGNPNGRPIGARNKYTAAIVQYLQENNIQDPLVTLAQLQQNSQDEGIRATAANMLAVYIHPKRGAIPTPPSPQFMEEAISLPRPTSISQATDNIARLSEMKAQGQLDFATADSLINDNRIILDALVDEAKLLAAAGGSPEQTIYIEGGMPTMPGHENLIMPARRMNGKDAIDPDAPPVDPPPEAQVPEP